MYSIHDFAQKGRNGVQKLGRPNILLLPETLGSPPKFLIVSVFQIIFIPSNISSTSEPNVVVWVLVDGGGSVLTLGHADHYVPICKPIGEVRLICANAALWCTITVRGEADAAQRSYCFFLPHFYLLWRNFLFHILAVLKPVLGLFSILFTCAILKMFLYRF